PPTEPARGPASACPSATGSSVSTAVRSRRPAPARAAAARLSCGCPARRWPPKSWRCPLATQPPHKSLRVLFVDDEQSLQEIMRTELPRMGHEVTVCPDGRAALKALEKIHFDAAILDLRMPGMTGIDVLQQLKTVSP